jgi:hypothetical protein
VETPFPFPPAVFAAMFGGTLGGQFLGMAVDAVAVGRRLVWVPLAFSVLIEAVVGERLASARLGHRLLAGERLRLSLYYSLGLAAVSIPLVGWLAVSHGTREQLSTGGGASSHDVILAGGLVLVGLVLYTALRTGLMTLFARRTL